MTDKRRTCKEIARELQEVILELNKLESEGGNFAS